MYGYTPFKFVIVRLCFKLLLYRHVAFYNVFHINSARFEEPDDTLAPFPLCFVSIIRLLFLFIPVVFCCLSVHDPAVNTFSTTHQPEALCSDLPPSLPLSLILYFHFSLFPPPHSICFTSCYLMFFSFPRVCIFLYPLLTADSFPGLRCN